MYAAALADGCINALVILVLERVVMPVVCFAGGIVVCGVQMTSVTSVIKRALEI